MPAPPEQTSTVDAGDVFAYVLVEIDETPESLIAAAQAKCLCAPGSHLELLAVAETPAAAHAGAAATFVADDQRQQATVALEHARNLLEPASARLVAGKARAALLAEALSVGATLVAVGMHPHRRLTARLFGTLDAAALHDAPCSVLVSRPGWGSTKPKRIVVGVDGSAASNLAVQVAESLASRLGVDLQPLIALGGRQLDETMFAPDHADALLDPRDAVTALAAAAGECDLLVVGSGGAHRRRARAPVWERVVYAAHSSVLVVRGAQAPA